ncbi:MAG: restriction endonuclease subunit S [Snowella sp.]|nr:restriction endonuclease subunit S [Snowella sp.]
MNERKDWKESSLPSLLKFMKSGGTPSTSRSDFYGGEIPFVSIEDMTSCSKYLSSTEKTITALGLKNSNTWLVPKEAILYSIYATLGIPRINIIPVTTNQAILALICDLQKVDNNFLFYWLDYIRDSIVNINSSQTTQKNLSATIVKTFSVYHPTNIKEQEKIAEVLSTVDKAISETEALIAKQQRIKTGLMQDLLTRGIDENGNLRNEETHQFKDSPLGRIPVEWEVKTLVQCANRVIVGLASSTTHAYRDIGIPLIRNQNIRRGYFDDTEILYLDPIFAASFPNKATRYGDVLTVRTGSNVGDTALVPIKYVGAPTFTTLITSTNNDILLSDYLVWYVNSQIGERELNRIMVGGGKENLNVGQFTHFRISVPLIKEQFKIIQLLQNVENQLSGEITSLDKLRSLKTGLMQELLTGKKRVTPLLENSPIF